MFAWIENEKKINVWKENGLISGFSPIYIWREKRGGKKMSLWVLEKEFSFFSWEENQGYKS